MTKSSEFVIEHIYRAPLEKTWKAITNKEKMKSWYFDLPEFQPEVGCDFRFWGGPTEDRQYHHICKIIEVIPLRMISYSWQYEGISGYTVVSFELFPEGNHTKLRLKHEGLSSFPTDNPDLSKENFAKGWSSIIGRALKEYLE